MEEETKDTQSPIIAGILYNKKLMTQCGESFQKK
jgi:hypothetical protein